MRLQRNATNKMFATEINLGSVFDCDWQGT
jgi:hypothetical protein